MAATTTPFARPRAARRIPRTNIMIYAALIFGAFFMVMPFVYMLSTSLKPQNQVFLYPPRWIPDPIVWANYPTAAVRLTLQAFLNSVLFTSIVVLGQGLITTMGGFAFARLRFPGRDVVFLGYLGTRR